MDANKIDMSSVVKVARYKLALKIHDAGEISLTAEDVAMIKALAGTAFAPLIIGRLYEALDPASMH